jgi:hypothetical protein
MLIEFLIEKNGSSKMAVPKLAIRHNPAPVPFIS